MPTFLQSPQEAANTFSRFGSFPKQRNVFLIRFVANNASLGNVTFAVKSIDRPRINPKTEQLNEYNKKRQVLTGYTLEPVRVQFYDSSDGAAQNMWTAYGRYYFGDMNQQAIQSLGINPSYSYDATLQEFKDPGTGFGFTGRNGGSANPDAQFFFSRVEIYHFYDAQFDLYYLFNPRISSWEPDDLDYNSSEIAAINATLVYENWQVFLQQPFGNGEFPEFEALFRGNVYVPTQSGTAITQSTPLSNALPSNPSIASLLQSAAATLTNVSSYRYNSSPSSGSLGLFGNFTFGPSGTSSLSTSLSTMSLGNPSLAAALNIAGVPTNVLAASNSVLANNLAATNQGINGALYDVVNAQTAGAFSGYGTAATTATGALMASQTLTTGSGAAVNSSGQVVLNPQAYGVINSQQTGTAQYGYNTQTDAEGDSWGYSGPNGYTGPNTNPQNFGPFNSNEAAGIDARSVNESDDITET